MSEMRDRYRVVVDGERSQFSWRKMDPSVREAKKAAEDHPDARIWIQRPDVLVQAGKASE